MWGVCICVCSLDMPYARCVYSCVYVCVALQSSLFEYVMCMCEVCVHMWGVCVLRWGVDMTYMRFMYTWVCVRNAHVCVALHMSLFVTEMSKDERCVCIQVRCMYIRVKSTFDVCGVYVCVGVCVLFVRMCSTLINPLCVIMCVRMRYWFEKKF